MIGQRIESQTSLPWLSLLLLSAGVAMLVGGLLFRLAPLSIASAMPIAIGLTGLLTGWDRHFVADFTEETIEIEDPPASIPYDSLRDVRAGGIPHDPWTYRKPSVAIHVQHEGGMFAIPARLNAPSHEVYRFLAGQVPANGHRDVNPALAEYLERQEGYYGPEQIWTYRAETRRRPKGRYRQLRAFCLGMMLAGVVWIVIGATGVAETGWAGGGVLCAGIALCFFLATFLNSSAGQTIKGWTKASLVIGPQGMAMVQGDIAGEVRWPELLEVRFKPRPAAFRMSYGQSLNGILLKVKGADILIADIYDRPLYVIHERIMETSGRSVPEVVDL